MLGSKTTKMGSLGPQLANYQSTGGKMAITQEREGNTPLIVLALKVRKIQELQENEVSYLVIPGRNRKNSRLKWMELNGFSYIFNYFIVFPKKSTS